MRLYVAKFASSSRRSDPMMTNMLMGLKSRGFIISEYEPLFLETGHVYVHTGPAESVCCVVSPDIEFLEMLRERYETELTTEICDVVANEGAT